MWVTVLALPVLVLDNVPRTDAHAAQVRTEAAVASTVPTTAPTTVPPSTDATTTTEATTTSAPAAKAVQVAPSTTRPRSTTTTTTAPKTTTTTAPANEQQGGASWYDYRPGECAHQTIPKGTTVTVTRIDTGASVTCVVTDRGPYGGGRIIDLDRSTFAQLADPSAGVIQVRITW